MVAIQGHSGDMAFYRAAHLTVLMLRTSRPLHIAMTAPAPRAGEEAEGRAGWGTKSRYKMETGGTAGVRAPKVRKSPRSTAWGHVRGKRPIPWASRPSTNVVRVGMKMGTDFQQISKKRDL